MTKRGSNEGVTNLVLVHGTNDMHDAHPTSPAQTLSEANQLLFSSPFHVSQLHSSPNDIRRIGQDRSKNSCRQGESQMEIFGGKSKEDAWTHPKKRQYRNSRQGGGSSLQHREALLRLLTWSREGGKRLQTLSNDWLSLC